jgi:hypothetical protein
VLLGVGDDALASNLSLEASDRAFNTLVILHQYSCHSRPPVSANPYPITKSCSLHNGSVYVNERKQPIDNWSAIKNGTGYLSRLWTVNVATEQFSQGLRSAALAAA